MNDLEKLFYCENEKEIELYGEGFLLSPAGKEDIETLKFKAKNDFNIELSNDYLMLLLLSDGFLVNGLSVYGAKIFSNGYFNNGILEANKAFWMESSLSKYISYGEESSMRLVFNNENKRYEAVDPVSWDVIESFETFYELLQYVLNDACIFD